MFSRRPVQYLGLLLLILASLAIIFIPLGPKPEARTYTLRLSAPKPWQQLAGVGKDVGTEADKALSAAFPATGNDPLPTGKLAVVPAAPGQAANGPFFATIEDRATTRPEADTRAMKIVAALAKKFPGVQQAPENAAIFADLPAKPIAPLGQYAIYPVKTSPDGRPIPAIKLGLDLQGGVNLVLQVRRALFTYNFNKKLGSDADERDRFATDVRSALAKAPSNANLSEVNVNLAQGADVIEVRTQAKDRNEFNAQRQAIAAALQSGVPGVKFTESREPQFFQPDQTAGQSLGFGNTYASELLDRTVEIVRSRVDRLGVSEPLIQKQLPDRIIVQLPGVNDPQKAVDVIGKTAQMEIRLLPQGWSVYENGDNVTFTDQSHNPVPSDQARKQSKLIVSGADVKPTSTVAYDEMNQPAVHFDLQGEGSATFARETAANVGRYMPIFLDEKCISAPTIRSAITGGSGQISGGFKNIEDARALALLLNSGALPAPIDVVENRTVSATLGTDSLVKSLRAGLLGILAVAVFMVVFYRLAGMLANFALVIYCVLNLAAFILIGGTLTLPGIAGFLLAIAMSLDTNILVFERLKEELAIQPTFAAALRAAFSRAWTAILDSHVTTLIAAMVLFFLGTGPVKGFALTLGVGVLLSLFSAISVTRLFMWSVARMGENNRNLFVGRAPIATPMAPVGRNAG